MKLEMYSIYDTKSETYYQPIFLLNEAMMLRQFADMANDKDCAISKHPEDYTLYHLGSWQDQDSKIKIINKTLIASAHEHVVQSRELKAI
jgi:hypothetical protein